MAEFCKQCCDELFEPQYGPYAGDFCGLITEEEIIRDNVYPIVLCEGCGPTQVDHEGKCIRSDCLEKHGVDNG